MLGLNRLKKVITPCLLFIAVPGIVILGSLLFGEKYYAWISVCVAILSCVPLLYSFEHREVMPMELTVLAVMIAVSVIGRCIFAWLPGFKPVTAITIIAALYLGKEAGFVVGTMSAVISDFYFGQGPWTPFQMFAWGMIGFFAGIFKDFVSENKVTLSVFGAISGVVYSMTLDIWTTIWSDGSFNVSRYLALVITSLPTTAEYVVSNILFLLLLSKPIGDELQRIKKKYGLFIT